MDLTEQVNKIIDSIEQQTQERILYAQADVLMTIIDAFFRVKQEVENLSLKNKLTYWEKHIECIKKEFITHFKDLHPKYCMIIEEMEYGPYSPTYFDRLKDSNFD